MKCIYNVDQAAYRVIHVWLITKEKVQGIFTFTDHKA